MHALDSSGFEPRYFCFNDLRRPSDPFRSLPLTHFLEELPFWGITGGVRPSIYAAINGAVLYHNLGNPGEYRHFIESIGIELDSIAPFTQAIDERYCRIKCDLEGRSMANANALAFIAVIDDFTKQIATQCKGAEIPAWCGVFFAMGIYGAYTRSSLTADILARSMEGSQLGESYLFEYIRNVGLQFDFMDEEDPMVGAQLRGLFFLVVDARLEVRVVDLRSDMHHQFQQALQIEHDAIAVIRRRPYVNLRLQVEQFDEILQIPPHPRTDEKEIRLLLNNTVKTMLSC